MSDIILTSEHTANTGYDYKVEIIDTSASSPSGETFVTKSIEIAYHPETDNILSPIIPSTAEITCYNQGGYFNSTFIPNLIVNQQERYQVKIYQDTGGGSGYELWWFGWVLQDQVEEVESSQPREFVLKCADGLSRLQGKEFDNANDFGTPVPRTAFNYILRDCLGYTGLDDLFTSTDDYLVTSVDWWEDTMTYGATNDPLDVSFLDLNIFQIKGEDGSETQYLTPYEVLRQVATLWNCRFYQSEGLWRFEQVGQRTGTTLKENVYRKTGIQNSATSSATYEYAVATNTGLLNARARDNNETFLPAAKRVQLEYEQAFLTSEIGQFRFQSGSSATQNAGLVEGLSEVGISLIIDYFAYADGVAVADRNRKHKVKYSIDLRLQTQGGTTYYYSNDDGGSWVTSADTYEFDSEEQKPRTVSTVRFAGNYTLLTAPLPADGYVTLQILLDDFYDYAVLGGAGWLPTTLSNEVWSAYGVIELEGENQNVKGTIYKSINNSGAIGDEDIIDLGTLNIGDSTFNTGRIIVYNGATYESTANWREGNSGSYTSSILQLLCNESLAYFNEPILVYDGDIYHSKSYQYRLNWGSNYYLPLECSFNTDTGVWSGRWFAIVRDKSNIAAETKYEKRKRLFRRITANSSPSDLPDGRIGNVEFEQDSGQFEGLVEFELTAAMIAAGQTGTTVINAQGSGTYIDVTHVVITTTSGSTPYATAGAQLYFSSETTVVVNSTNLLDSINNGSDRRLTGLDGKLWANEALLFDINADATGDYEFLIKVYYKLIS